ncbi:MAG TPA: hypothetical protein VIA06_02195 [Candidatus Dormibacteraeota bacterium]|jgi:hypothetical protein|nr:hypothetical protein [Candidatus Dormibacteraeota bacterium]
MKVRQIVSSHWSAIRKVAGGHGIETIGYWPPAFDSRSSADFLVKGELGSLRGLRADLERELGCRVAIYLADQAPASAHEAVVADEGGEPSDSETERTGGYEQ